MEVNYNIKISVKGLYETFGEELYLNTIRKMVSDGHTYYYLSNEFGELACMDEEEVNITQKGNNLISFVNNSGEYSAYFALTYEEAKVAMGGFNHN